MRVMLADDQAKVRFALRVLLQQQPDTEVVAEAVDAQDLLEEVGSVRPDLVLLDGELPGATLDALLAAMHACCAQTRVIVLSGRPEAHARSRMAGADAFVSKSHPPEILLMAINQVCGRQPGECPPPNDSTNPGEFT